MTDLKKRTLLKVAALIRCGECRPGRLRQEGRGPRAAPAASAPVAKPEPLKIAFAYVGPVGDGGWTFAHDNGRKALEKEFGDKIVTASL